MKKNNKNNTVKYCEKRIKNEEDKKKENIYYKTYIVTDKNRVERCWIYRIQLFSESYANKIPDFCLLKITFALSRGLDEISFEIPGS